MSKIKTFWVEYTDKVQWTYTADAAGPCPIHGDGHKASSTPIILPKKEHPVFKEQAPTHCSCGYMFKTGDVTGHGEPSWKRLDSDIEEFGKLPPGACYVDEPYENKGRLIIGYDGLCIVVVLPNLIHFITDERSSNCGSPNDNEHRCWCRHGSMGEDITLDKVGNTCIGGAGSIIAGNWHGFLKAGYLESC